MIVLEAIGLEKKTSGVDMGNTFLTLKTLMVIPGVYVVALLV